MRAHERVGWTQNPAAHGLVVNGDNVLATGLAVGTIQAEPGGVERNNGRKPSSSRMNHPRRSEPERVDEWNRQRFSPYSVSPSVTNHQAYGLGVYSNFSATKYHSDSAITVPVASGVNGDGCTDHKSGFDDKLRNRACGQ